MIVEVIAVGTELLIGQIINSNVALIGGRLAEQGLDAHFQVTVGDNLDRVAEAIRIALDRSDSVIVTGGIGPTQDDLTREAICQVTERSMTRDEAHAAWIEDRLRSQGRLVPRSVLRMADLPEGAEGLANGNGVALGITLEHRGKTLFALPGVPVEMVAMLDNEVLPRLRTAAGSSGVLRSRFLRTWGYGESEVADRLDDLFASTNPSVAFLIKDMEVQVRISAKAVDSNAAERLIDPVETEVRSRLGEAVFGVGDETVEKLVIDGLGARGWTVSTAERATLGQVGSRLAAADHSGSALAGTVFGGGQTELIPPLADVTVVVSAAGEEASQGRRLTRPVEIAVTTPDMVTTQVFHFGGDDERVRSFATIAALHQIRIAVDVNPARP